jgi:hypothetical protein
MASEDRPQIETERLASKGPGGVEARASPRYAIRQAIRFTRTGASPAPGSLVNISQSGALGRVKYPEKSLIPPWPLHLRHGDELWVADLIDLPLRCWVIDVEIGLIRMHFYNDRKARPLLHALIARLASEQASREHGEMGAS